MFYKLKLLSTTAAACLAFGAPVFAEAGATKILDEYFDIFKSTPLELAVGDKDDAGKYTQWNNITLKSSDGNAQMAIPWIKVSKKFFGGYEMTMAERIDGAFQSPDPDSLKPIAFAIESKGMNVDIGGKEGARKYTSSFDQMTLKTVDNDEISVSAMFKGGSGTQVATSGDLANNSGDFNVPDVVIDYSLKVEGQAMTSSTVIKDLSGSFVVPIYGGDFDQDNPTASFDASRDLWFEYSAASGSTKASVGSPAGPIEVSGDFGIGTGTFGIKDSVASISGESKDLDYNITLAALGMPPMQFSISDAIANIVVPLDNVEETKSAGYKVALSNVVLSDQVWAMFDPTALLPRDAIDLDIDLAADLRWVKKIKDIDPDDMEQAPPIMLERAEIKAVNLKIAGAELKTFGAMDIDTSQFPPVPEGTVNVSLKGAQGLIGKLSQIGLVPPQTAAMVMGMSSAFFKPGEDGDDHLVSVIEMTKDGHVSANGVSLQ